jgi:phage terminase large subunit
VEKQRVEIPYAPRRWAKGLHSSYKRWSALILHRRAGKTTAILNHHQRAATDDAWELARLRFLLPDAPQVQLQKLLRNRVYWHVMPTIKQAKLVAWDMLKEFSRPIPGIKVNNSDLLITYPPGPYGTSKLQLLGADDPDSLRGPALSGLSLDEYSQIPGNAFGEVLSKALGDHLGYCVFSGTIKGKDQLYQTYTSAKTLPEWYTVWQDIDTSLKTESGPTITALVRAMDDDRKLVLQGVMSQAEFDQEWYLSPEAAIKGAIYGDQLAAARKEGRVTRVPIEPTLPVDTDWDIGMGDSTAIWFTQSLRSGEVRVVDYYETTGEGIPQLAAMLKAKGYVYGQHWGPHDIVVQEFGTGKTRVETAREFGLKFEVTPRIHGEKGVEVEEGIKATRLFLSRCWFDETRCAAGLEALLHYRRDFNERLQEFKATPVHNWASHGADSFRGLAVRHKTPVKPKAKDTGEGYPRSQSGQSWMR